MHAIGLDPGTTRQNPAAVALVRWLPGDPAPILLGTTQLTPARHETLAEYLGRLGARLRTDWLGGVTLLAVEWPYVGENPQSALDLAACCGAALAAAGEAGVTTHLVSPAQAKQALVGVGNATKEQMIAAVRVQFGRALPKDQADAVGIALAGLVIVRRAVQLPLPKRQTRIKTKKG